MIDHIEIYDHVLDDALCDEIIKKFEEDGAIARGVMAGGMDLTKKDSHDINISASPEWRPLHDRVINATSRGLRDYMRKYSFTLTSVQTTIATDPRTGLKRELTHEDIAQLSDVNLGRLIARMYRPGQLLVQKYDKGVGGYHQWHSEHSPRDASCEELHRVLFFIHYLNTVENGGETAFFYQNRKVEPRKGRMVIAPAAFTHTHKGNVPVSSDKYIATSWVLFQRAENLQT